MNNLQDFLSSFPREFQRPSRYICQILIPQGLAQAIATDDAQNNARQSSVPQVISLLTQGLLVDTAFLPDRSFGMIDLAMYGFTEHFPYHSEYTTLKCTLLMPLTESGISAGIAGVGISVGIQADNPVPRFFNYWHDQIQDNESGPSAGLDFGFPSDYYATILLTLFDRQNNATITYQFDKVYPKVIGSVEVAWSASDKFMMLPIEFMFSYWTIVPETPGGINIGVTFGPISLGATII